jgi:hypothetical protein
MNEEKTLRNLRYLAKKMGLSILTGLSDTARPNLDGEWKIGKYGRKYRQAYVDMKGYAIRNNRTGELITPINRHEITRSGSSRFVSDITIVELESIIEDLYKNWKNRI